MTKNTWIVEFINKAQRDEYLYGRVSNVGLRPFNPLKVQPSFMNAPISFLMSKLTPSTVTPLSDKAVLVDQASLLASVAAGARVIENQRIEPRLYVGSGPSASSADKKSNWALERYGLRDIHQGGLTGKGVRVGIIDSGIDAEHPAFATMVSDDRLSAYAHFDEEGRLVSESSGTDAGYSGSHGTHCAGTLLGQNSDDVLIGTAPGVQLYVAHIIDENDGFSVLNMYAALSWMRQWKCDILSLSLGWQGERDQWMVPIAELIRGGSLLICAAGNDFTSNSNAPTMSPANYPFKAPAPSGGGLVSVGAFGKGEEIWDDSGGGSVTWTAGFPDDFSDLLDGTGQPVLVPDLAGPGVDIGSSVPQNRYDLNTGTSMSVPFVAGISALVLEKQRLENAAALPVGAMETVLRNLSDRPPSGPDDRYGRGVLDAAALARIFT